MMKWKLVSETPPDTYDQHERHYRLDGKKSTGYLIEAENGGVVFEHKVGGIYEIVEDLFRVEYLDEPPSPGEGEAVAIAFAEWVSEEGWSKHTGQDWWSKSFSSEYCEPVNSAGLYQLFPGKVRKEVGEEICQKCGCHNPVWSAENDLFNKVNGSPNGIVCPVCFINAAKKLGVDCYLRITAAPPPAGEKMRGLIQKIADTPVNESYDQWCVYVKSLCRQALSQPPGNDEWVSKPGENSVFARVEGDCIVIRCGIKDLVFIVENDPEYKYKVHDPVRFAAEMCFEINNSKSFRNNDGMNAAEELFQNAYEKVYEQGNDEVMTGDDCL